MMTPRAHRTVLRAQMTGVSRGVAGRLGRAGGSKDHQRAEQGQAALEMLALLVPRRESVALAEAADDAVGAFVAYASRCL